MSADLIGGANPAFKAKQNTASQTTLGVAATATTTADVFGSWAQVTASSAADYYVTGLSIVKTGGNSAAASQVLIEVGYGGSGSEVTLGTATVAGEAADVVGGQAQFLAPLRIAAGQRIAVRVANNPTAGSTAHQYHLYLWLVPFASIEGN